MKIFYHGDADGKVSGHIVYDLVEGDTYEKEAIKINYDIPFPFEIIQKDELVYIVDYSISPDEMRKLLAITKNVVWIDHHITAINKYKSFEYDIPGLRYDGIAGCELVYIYVNFLSNLGVGRTREFDPKMVRLVPMWIRYIADRDVWKWEFGEDTKHFYAGFQLLDTTPGSSDYEHFKKAGFVEEVIANGKTVEQFKKVQREEYLEAFSFDCKIKGFEHYKVIATNIGRQSSELYDSLKEEYDVFCNFVWNGKEFSVSVYQGNKSVDVSEIAVHYGGGGHRGAAGFQCKELPIIPL